MAGGRKGRGRARKGRGRPRARNGNAADFAVSTRISNASMPTFRCKRSYNYGNITPIALEFGNWFGMLLSNVPNVGEFTSLFQEYRITRFAYTFTWLSANNANNVGVILHTAPQFRNSTAPTSLNDVMEISGVHKIALGSDHRQRQVVVSRPMVDISTNSSTSYLVKSPWLQTTDTGVLHYGFWIWYQHFTTTYALGQVLDVNVEVSLEFRGTH